MRPQRFPDPRPGIWAGLVFMLVVTVACYSSDLDLLCARGFWAPTQSWPGREAFWAWLPYRVGAYPALITGILGLLAFVLSYQVPRLQRWRGPGLYLGLLLLLGPGLFVNVLAKGLTGRPRPSDLIDFGGAWNYLRPWQFGVPGQGMSFISGHASMAFFWFSLGHLQRRRGARLLAFLGALAFGLWMGAARMAQGGHFLSDILLCGALLWILAAGLSPLIHWQPPASFWARPKLLSALALLAAAALYLGHPVFEQRDLLWARPGRIHSVLATQRVALWQPPADITGVALQMEVQRGDVFVDFQAIDDGSVWPLQLEEELSGLGLPGAKAKLEQITAPMKGDPRVLNAAVAQTLPGAWWQLQGHYHVALPKTLGVDLRLKTSRGLLTIGSLPKGRQVLVNGPTALQDLPVGFHAFAEHSWLREGAQPQIVLDLSAPAFHFEP